MEVLVLRRLPVGNVLKLFVGECSSAVLGHPRIKNRIILFYRGPRIPTLLAVMFDVDLCKYLRKHFILTFPRRTFQLILWFHLAWGPFAKMLLLVLFLAPLWGNGVGLEDLNVAVLLGAERAPTPLCTMCYILTLLNLGVF